MDTLNWRKSTDSPPYKDCVEVADLPDGGKAVRNSKDHGEGTQKYTHSEWDAFLKGAKRGEFD